MDKTAQDKAANEGFARGLYMIKVAKLTDHLKSYCKGCTDPECKPCNSGKGQFEETDEQNDPEYGSEDLGQDMGGSMGDDMGKEAAEEDINKEAYGSSSTAARSGTILRLVPPATVPTLSVRPRS